MNSLRIAVLALAIASSSVARAKSFFGATVPSRYFHAMLGSLDSWTVPQQEFFRKRAIQARGWFPNQTVMLVDSDEDMVTLGRYFDAFRNKMAESGSFNGITALMKGGYPKLASALPNAEISSLLFHGFGSPAEYFWETCDSGRKFRKLELDNILRLLEEGHRWEAKHPQLDFMLPQGSPLVDRLTLSFPKLQVRPTWRGYRIRDIYTQVQNSR